MKRTLKIALACTISTLAAAAAAQPAAQPYPSKPVRYIVSGGAGSGTDTLARLVANGITQVFGRQVAVDDRPGSGSNIAAELAARAPADGYTLFQPTQTHAVNVTLYQNLKYNVLTDFAPITLLATGPAAVTVHPSLPAKTIAELVRLAKARPGDINYSSGGSGTFSFLGAELFKAQAGVNLVHIPYKGGAGAFNAVMSGEVSVQFAPIVLTLPQLAQGRVRALAVTSAQRIALAPQLPTVAESGYPDYESGNWYGLFAPAKTPPDVIRAVHAAALSTLKDPAVTRRLNDLGYVAIGNQPDEFGAYVKLEVERLGKIIRDLKLKPEE